ncbi:uncharacterized protein LOC100833421 [Brachypodium distachyon]|uniref:Uncharacterized protein n=1 Tax=Brachypodium distachyon TaxID=15368 RepID=I1H1A8_BRADI|nr:uncharacterized protein LOC100833421 [Brachypodium distachyon]KQK19736.1 hypothetical protein BRADI_1g50120v3 [Brachypodium distachyon]|eukprot:XP_003557141.1 uncharacterized protein LOC100833421 [Brachypodium distachyon]
MDKILAFSILSSSPADIAGGGAGYATTRVISWRSGADTKKQQQQQAEEKKKKVRQSAPLAERKPEARFAPEFDGINCFESIVSF